MNASRLRLRRLGALIVITLGVVMAILGSGEMWQPAEQVAITGQPGTALQKLEAIEIKGRAPKTGYERSQFGDGWKTVNGCDMRNTILHRDLTQVVADINCKVLSGTLNDPYTGSIVHFKRGADSSADVQIDHVVPLSDAWQKGAQQLSAETREVLANDPLELLAVDGKANQEKSDGDAATWLPPNKSFRCQYVARQIAVKAKYGLWMTAAERDAIRAVLSRCPNQTLPAA